MSIAEKLRRIREHKGFTQLSFADAIGCGISKICETEGDKRACTEDEDTKLKVLLEIEGAPLTNEEVEKFRKRFYVWRDYIWNRRIDKAQKLCEELEIVKQQPYEVYSWQAKRASPA